MHSFTDFFSFSNANVVYVVLGMICINASSALVGTFAFLRKRSLIGDAVAHSLLPGICFGYLVAGEKNPVLLLAGAFLTGWISIFLVDYIVRHSRLKQDTAIGVVLSSFFALGVVLLTYIQKTGSGNHAGLDHFLFGQAAAITRDEVSLFVVILVIILTVVVVFYRQLVLLSFNPEYAATIGLPVRLFEFVLTSLTVLAIAAGIQALGVILISALIITPAAAARLWTHNLKWLMLLAVVISIFCGVTGAYISYARTAMPTGPWVVVTLSLITLGSICFAPRRGFVSRYYIRRKNSRKITDENILKTIFKLPGFQNQDTELTFTRVNLTEIRPFDTKELHRGIDRLIRRGLIQKSGDDFVMTTSGRKESARIVKLHRLWEQYLLRRTRIDTDHVHSGAEAIEHIITPEIEAELERELGIKGIPEDDY
ncbi:MAG: metal ABC transporter permease [Bacteroidetes bacterium]|nr:metal ABC transporter permease [Bacteroidota bacterium]